MINFLSDLQRQPDITSLTETKLITGHDILSNVNMQGYTFIHIDSLTLADGVAIYVHDNIKFDVTLIFPITILSLNQYGSIFIIKI